MSFRQNKNSNDEWLSFKDKMRDSFEMFISEDLTLLNQKSFERYLMSGNDSEFQTPLSELSNDNFLVLEKIVDEWNSFQIGFESFYLERIKRFTRYG